MKFLFKSFLFLIAVAAAAGGAYYYFFMRQQKPQVELYFDDGSMLALQGDAPEATAFLGIADEVLAKSPVVR